MSLQKDVRSLIRSLDGECACVLSQLYQGQSGCYRLIIHLWRIHFDYQGAYDWSSAGALCDEPWPHGHTYMMDVSQKWFSAVLDKHGTITGGPTAMNISSFINLDYLSLIVARRKFSNRISEFLASQRSCSQSFKFVDCNWQLRSLQPHIHTYNMTGTSVLFDRIVLWRASANSDALDAICTSTPEFSFNEIENYCQW